MDKKLAVVQFLLLSLVLTGVQPIWAETGKEAYLRQEREAKKVRDDLGVYFREVWEEAEKDPKKIYYSNAFNYKELRNTTASMMYDFKKFEAEFAPQFLYHWASDYEIEEIKKDGLPAWLEKSRYFWRSPLGSFMYGENRQKKYIEQGGSPNLIRIKLKPGISFIDIEDYFKHGLKPGQLIIRRIRPVIYDSQYHWTNNVLMSFFEYVFEGSWGQKNGRTQQLLDTIESFSINHSGLIQEIKFEMNLAKRTKELGMPYFESYARVNGLPTLVAPEYEGQQSGLWVDGHGWDESVFNSRVSTLLNRIKNKENSLLIYGDGVSAKTNPHYTSSDLKPQSFTAKILEKMGYNDLSRSYLGKLKCPWLFQ